MTYNQFGNMYKDWQKIDQIMTGTHVAQCNADYAPPTQKCGRKQQALSLDTRRKSSYVDSIANVID